MAYLAGFDTFSERGTLRDYIHPGLFIVGFESRMTIAFSVWAEEVVFVNVLYDGRDSRENIRS